MVPHCILLVISSSTLFEQRTYHQHPHAHLIGHRIIAMCSISHVGINKAFCPATCMHTAIWPSNWIFATFGTPNFFQTCYFHGHGKGTMGHRIGLFAESTSSHLECCMSAMREYVYVVGHCLRVTNCPPFGTHCRHKLRLFQLSVLCMLFDVYFASLLTTLCTTN